MKGLNQSPENGKRNGVIGLGLGPDHGPSTINVKVSHGDAEHDVSVPSNSSFGDLKSVIAQRIGLKPENCKLLFRGKEKEDDEDLQTAGVKENSKVLLIECTTCEQEAPEEVKETNVVSKGGEAVAEVRKEVDKLAEQVLEVQAAVDNGTKVDDKKFIYVTEMLMRQLLKLDGIDAEGEGRVQRKMEVRRVQSLVDTMDVLKSRNSNPYVDNVASVSTQWESFEPSAGDGNAASTMPSPAHSSVPVSSPAPAPAPAPAPSSVSSSAPTPVPAPATAPARSSAPNPLPSSSPHVHSSSPPVPPHDSTHMPSYDPNLLSSYAASAIPSYAPSYPPSYGTTPMPSYNPYRYASSSVQPYDPNPSYYPPPTIPDYNHSSHAPFAPYPGPSHAPYPGLSHAHYPPQFYGAHPSQSHAPHPSQSYAPHPNPYHDPSSMPSHAPRSTQNHVPSSMQSSTKVTQDWERFD